MRKQIAFITLFLAVLAALPRPVTASPEKSAAKLDVTYYYLPG